jgi:hypothetical protein
MRAEAEVKAARARYAGVRPARANFETLTGEQLELWRRETWMSKSEASRPLKLIETDTSHCFKCGADRGGVVSPETKWKLVCFACNARGQLKTPAK